MKIRLLLIVLALLSFAPVLAQDATEEPTTGLTLEVLGGYSTDIFDEGGAEIAAYHPESNTVFVVNGASSTIDILDISDPTNPTQVMQIDATEYGGSANSVSIYDDVVAVAIEADPAQEAGLVAFFDVSGVFINSVPVGALPDMLTFTPDGTKVVVANEGEPSDDYANDPEGSVSIIDVEGGAANLSEESVTTVTFTDFNEDGSRSAELPEDVRVYGPNATVAQDLEPEYVVVSPDSTTAFVVLQEANAYAEIDLKAGTVTAIRAFGFKDHSQPGNGLDAGGDDGTINIANWNVFGMYQPDAMALYEVEGTLYLITANEGDTRDYEDSFSEEGEMGESAVDEEAFPNLDELVAEEAIGGLEVMTSIGDTDGDGDLDELYIPGGRSFSVWNPLNGELIFDSGDQIEQITAETYPDDFNADNAENGTFDDRSDNKGPEPEGLALGMIGNTTYAFIALERIGGIMVYDLTDPTAPTFVTYVNNRDFSGDAEAGTAGDLGPEGLVFIPAAESPNGNNFLVVANEVSGTTTIYQVNGAE